MRRRGKDRSESPFPSNMCRPKIFQTCNIYHSHLWGKKKNTIIIEASVASKEAKTGTYTRYAKPNTDVRFLLELQQ